MISHLCEYTFIEIKIYKDPEKKCCTNNDDLYDQTLHQIFISHKSYVKKCSW